MYEIPNNMTGLNDMFIYANDVTSNWFGMLFGFSLPIIIFVLLRAKGYRASDSFAIASILAFVLGTLEFAVGILAGRYVIILLIFSIAGFVWSIVDD